MEAPIYKHSRGYHSKETTKVCGIAFSEIVDMIRESCQVVGQYSTLAGNAMTVLYVLWD